MTDLEVLICAPAPNGYVPGSIIVPCWDCGVNVTVAPSGQRKLLNAAGVHAVCISCGLTRIEADPDAVVAAPTAEQLEELRAFQRRYRRCR